MQVKVEGVTMQLNPVYKDGVVSGITVGIEPLGADDWHFFDYVPGKVPLVAHVTARSAEDA